MSFLTRFIRFDSAAAARSLLVLTAPFVALPVYAQTQSSGATSSTGQTAGKPSPVSAKKLDEVMVTAEKVSKPASKTPISLSVLSGDDLKAAGVINASNLTDRLPNVQIGQGNGGGVNISIRGVTSHDDTEKGDPSASFNIDGVNISHQLSAGVAFYDLDRVEVLRGPQGTLYGKNSTAGAVNLVTNKPTDQFGGDVSVDFGNYGSVRTQGALNLPVSDMVSFRFAFATNKHDGYLHTANSTNNFTNDRDDDDTTSARLESLIKFSQSTQLLLTVDATHTGGVGPGTLSYDTFRLSGSAQRTVDPRVEGSNRLQATGFSAQLTSDLGFAELTYILSRRVFDSSYTTSFGSAAEYHYGGQDIGTTTNELRLASNSTGPLQWQAGVFVSSESGDGSITVRPDFIDNGIFIQHNDPITSDSQAIFGQLTYSLTDSLRVTAGVRDTHDKKERKNGYDFFVFSGPAIYDNSSASTTKVTGKLGLEYDLTPKIMLYGSYSDAFKAGGFNDGTAATNVDLYYRPETLTAAEAGIKGRFFNDDLDLSADVFHYNYKNIQLTTVGLSGAQTTNAARATVDGGELEGTYRLSADDTSRLNFSVGLLHAVYDSYQYSPTVSWSGYTLDKSPKRTANLGYAHDWDVGSDASITASVDERYSSSYVISNYGVQQFTNPAFSKTNLSLTYNAAGGKWYAQAYVNNLQNKTQIVDYVNAFGDWFKYSDPRLFGVRVGLHF